MEILRKSGSLLVFLLYSMSLLTQPYFSTSINLNKYYNSVGAIIVDDSAFFFQHLSLCEGGVPCSGVLKTDLGGNVVWVDTMVNKRTEQEASRGHDSSGAAPTTLGSGAFLQYDKLALANTLDSAPVASVLVFESR